jgi:hypothetical protein
VIAKNCNHPTNEPHAVVTCKLFKRLKVISKLRSLLITSVCHQNLKRPRFAFQIENMTSNSAISTSLKGMRSTQIGKGIVSNPVVLENGFQSSGLIGVHQFQHKNSSSFDFLIAAAEIHNNNSSGVVETTIHDSVKNNVSEHTMNVESVSNIEIAESCCGFDRTITNNASKTLPSKQDSSKSELISAIIKDKMKMQPSALDPTKLYPILAGSSWTFGGTITNNASKTLQSKQDSSKSELVSAIIKDKMKMEPSALDPSKLYPILAGSSWTFGGTITNNASKTLLSKHSDVNSIADTNSKSKVFESNEITESKQVLFLLLMLFTFIVN